MHPAADHLTNDGDTYEDAEHGITLRLCVTPDQDHSIDNDGDWFGKVAWCDHTRDLSGYSRRPEGFNGRARKLWTQHDAYWWQPPDDVTDENLDTLQSTLVDLMNYGWNGYIVEVLRGEDAYHRPIVIGTAGLWGVECFAEPSYIRSFVPDLIHEALADAGLDPDDYKETAQ